MAKVAIIFKPANCFGGTNKAPSRKQPSPAPNPTPAGLLSYITFSRVVRSQLAERAGRP